MNGYFYQCFNNLCCFACGHLALTFAACPWLPRLNADFRVRLVGLAAACAGASNQVISCCYASLSISAGGFLGGSYNVLE